MASFGKIILFRTEDLGTDNSNAFQPILGVEDQKLDPNVDLDLVSTLKPIPFNIQTNLDNSTTAKQNYRILTKNYRVGGDNSLSSERYEEFYRSGNRRKNLVLGINKKQFFKQFEDTVISFDAIEFLTVKYPNPSDDPNFINIFNSIGQQYSVSGKLTFDSSSDSFTNHNLSLSKPLTSNTTIDGEAPNLEQFGIGDTLKIAPVYNYYLKD